jgi:hypothetical protein
MKPGDLVRIVQRNQTHGGKIALIMGTDVSSWFSIEAGCDKTEIVFEILMEGQVKRDVSAMWLETINETR